MLIAPHESQVVHGYAARFNVLAVSKLEGRRVIIEPGAFVLPDPSGFGPQVSLLWNGNWHLPLGSTGDGSLTLEQNNGGLYVEWRPNAHVYPQAKTAFEHVANWKLNGLCVFIPDPYEGYFRDDGVRIIRRCQIGHISLTVAGCCPGTGCKVMTGGRESAESSATRRTRFEGAAVQLGAAGTWVAA